MEISRVGSSVLRSRTDHVKLKGIIRSWGRIASSSGAFGLLRVLSCCSQKDITANVFAHLNQFPALSLFNVEDCNLGRKHRQAARNHGWNYKAGKDLGDWLVKDGATSTGWDSIVHATFQLGGAFSEKTLTAEGVEAINAIPVLHISLGAPQPVALIDIIGNRSLRSYSRGWVDTIGHPNKRPLSQTLAPSINMSPKKPTMRASKQQKMVECLEGFGDS